MYILGDVKKNMPTGGCGRVDHMGVCMYRKYVHAPP
jgi:hypothetical protein